MKGGRSGLNHTVARVGPDRALARINQETHTSRKTEAYNPGRATDSTKNMDLIQLARTGNDAWNKHDLETVLAGYSENATYSHPRLGEKVGKEGIANFFKAVWAAYPDMTVEIVSLFEDGAGLVASQTLIRGRNTGAFPDGTPPTGRNIIAPQAIFSRYDGEKIASEEVYLDVYNVLMQLGFAQPLPQYRPR